MTKLCFTYYALFFILLSCRKDIVQEEPSQLYKTYSTAFEELVSDCGLLRTQTPGGWGAPPRGNNPASYLYANFSIAFPNGLTIGCAGGKTLTVTSAQAITNLLPTGGTAAVLSVNSIDPTGVKNVLVGHLIALSLSTGFDYYDKNFGAAKVNLGDMVIGSGPFAGTTVNVFLNIANDVIGDCSAAFTIQDVLSTATQINESFVDGTIHSSFLKCPETTPR